MKIVIYTQYRENYAAHNGFTGEYQWKSKGGSTYVIPNLNWMDIEANRELANKACAFVSYDNQVSAEYVIDWSFEEDNAIVCEKWESEIFLTRNDDGTWTKSIKEEGHYNFGLTKSEKIWQLDSEGEVITYEAKWFHPEFGWFLENDIPHKALNRFEWKKEIRTKAEYTTVFNAYHLYSIHNSDAEYSRRAA